MDKLSDMAIFCSQGTGIWSWGSPVSILIRLQAGEPGSDSRQGNIQAGSGADPASYPMSTGTLFPGSKVARA